MADGLDGFAQVVASTVDVGDAERGVIACALADETREHKVVARATQLLGAGDFGNAHNAAVWTAILAVTARGNIADTRGAAQINADLTAYLNAFVARDGAALADGEVTPLPTAAEFGKLQDDVHSVAYRSGDSVPEASGMVSAAAALTAAQSKVTAVAQRTLPALLLVLIFISGGLLAVAMGTAAATVERPTLMYGWAFVGALSLALVLLLDYPFGGGISVNLEPVAQVARAVAG